MRQTRNLERLIRCNRIGNRSSQAIDRLSSVDHRGDDAPQILPGKRARLYVAPEIGGSERERLRYCVDALESVRPLIMHVFLKRGTLAASTYLLKLLRR
jgi:hypothetical protein